MKKSKEDLGKSILKRLSNLAKQLQVPFKSIATEFLLERLAARLVDNPQLSKKLIFKGGYVGLRVYESPRYTVDLDAIFQGSSIEQITKFARQSVESDLDDGVWFHFERSLDLETQSEYGGIRLIFRAGIGEVLRNINLAQVVHLDIGSGDPVTPAPLQTETPFLLGEGSLSWRVYPVETTVAEKLHTLIVRHSDNSRSKDIFDLYYLIPKCDQSRLKSAISATFKFRGDLQPEDFAGVLREMDTSLMERGWTNAVISIGTPIDFETAYGLVVQYCQDFLNLTQG